MFKLAVSLVLMAGTAHATMPFPGMANSCTMAANAATMDYTMLGSDPDGTSITFDEKGATQISRPENIVSRSNKDGVETITYKTRQIKMDGTWKPGQPYEYETVQRTITIKRDNGKIVSVNKDMDLASQVRMRKLWEKNGFKGNYPFTKSMETTFSHNGSNCDINQTLTYEMANENAKVEGKVVYDKQFCDKLAPMVKRMGSQNASQCVGLIAQAQFAFDQRNKELQKDGRSFKLLDFPGKKAGDPSANMDIGMFISSCAMAEGGPWGLPGTGLMPGGGMMGMVMGGIAPEAPKANTNSGASSTGTGTR